MAGSDTHTMQILIIRENAIFPTQSVAKKKKRKKKTPKKIFIFQPHAIHKNNTCKDIIANHLEERLLDQAQARAPYTPLFGGHSRSILQGMIFDVQPLVKSLFCPIRPSPNGFFDSEASIP